MFPDKRIKPIKKGTKRDQKGTRHFPTESGQCPRLKIDSDTASPGRFPT